MKKNGRAESTIKCSINILMRLNKLCNLEDPESAKNALANLKWSNNTKNGVAGILKVYYQFLQIPYEKPKYAKQHKLPFIPTEEELDTLIASATTKPPHDSKS